MWTLQAEEVTRSFTARYDITNEPPRPPAAGRRRHRRDRCRSAGRLWWPDAVLRSAAPIARSHSLDSESWPPRGRSGRKTIGCAYLFQHLVTRANGSRRFEHVAIRVPRERRLLGERWQTNAFDLLDQVLELM